MQSNPLNRTEGIGSEISDLTPGGSPLNSLSSNGRAKTRQLDIDLIKSIAVLCIVCVHSRGNGYWTPVGSFSWLSTLFWCTISGMGVPLFFLCSGALMLNPDKPLSMRKLFGRSIPRLLIALFFWAAVYSCLHLTIGKGWSVQAAVAAFKDLLLFRHEPHLYFMHIIILVYACLPITRIFVKAANRAQIRYFLAIWFACGILWPALINFWPFTLIHGIPMQWVLNLSWAAIGYGVLGYALKNNPPSRLSALLLTIAGFLLVFFPTWYLSAKQGKLDLTLSNGASPGVCLLSAGIFSLCVGARPGKWAVFLSRSSFCIYLAHYIAYLFIDFQSLWGNSLPYIISIPLTTLSVVGLSIPVYLLLSHIPVVKKWLI